MSWRPSSTRDKCKSIARNLWRLHLHSMSQESTVHNGLEDDIESAPIAKTGYQPAPTTDSHKKQEPPVVTHVMKNLYTLTLPLFTTRHCHNSTTRFPSLPPAHPIGATHRWSSATCSGVLSCRKRDNSLVHRPVRRVKTSPRLIGTSTRRRAARARRGIMPDDAAGARG
jgi:hypothetical protein